MSDGRFLGELNLWISYLNCQPFFIKGHVQPEYCSQQIADREAWGLYSRQTAHIVLRKGKRQATGSLNKLPVQLTSVTEQTAPFFPLPRLHALTKVFIGHLFHKPFVNFCHRWCETYLNISHYNLSLFTLKIWETVVLLLSLALFIVSTIS